MNTNKVAICCPVHIQPTKKWVAALKREAKGHTVIIVDDSDGKVILPKEWDVYDYKRQKEELGKDLYKEFERFHKSSSCRNFGHWIAYKKNIPIVITLDSDCVVPEGFVEKHVYALEATGYGWVNPIEDVGWFPRGYPYHERNRRIACNIGLWENELDLGGLDRIQRNSSGPKSPKVKKQKIAHTFIPHCGMNTSFWTNTIPGMLFLPNFDDGAERFRRLDDIWGGYIYQKIMQKNKDLIAYGFPIVYHDSDLKPVEDMKDEEAMLHWEEAFYNMVDTCMDYVPVGSYQKMMKEFAFHFEEMCSDTVFKEIVPALNFWVKLYA